MCDDVELLEIVDAGRELGDARDRGRLRGRRRGDGGQLLACRGRKRNSSGQLSIIRGGGHAPLGSRQRSSDGNRRQSRAPFGTPSGSGQQRPRRPGALLAPCSAEQTLPSTAEDHTLSVPADEATRVACPRARPPRQHNRTCRRAVWRPTPPRRARPRKALQTALRPAPSSSPIRADQRTPEDAPYNASGAVATARGYRNANLLALRMARRPQSG
jgi:hypothetical protein